MFRGHTYEGTSFVFDKVYNNHKAMMDAAADDGVFVGRYVLIKYCEEALSQDARNTIETHYDSGNDTYPSGEKAWINDEWNNYFTNYKADNLDRTKPKISCDRKVFRKIYKDSQETYEEIASLNSTLSDDNIAVKGLNAEEKILSIDKNGDILSSTLSLTHNSGELYLTGKNSATVGDKISTSFLVSENVIQDDYLKIDNNNNNKLYLDLSKLVQTDDPILSMTDDEKLRSNLYIDYYNRDDKTYIGLVRKDIETNEILGIISEFNASEFVKDSFLQNVTYTGENELVFTFLDAWGNTITTPVTLDIMDPGKGVQINGNIISIKLADDSETFLSVGDSGLKLSGVKEAVENAQKNAIAKTKNTIYENEPLEEIPNGTNVGDTAIIKTLIADDKYSYTAYVWNGEAWTAMDGNYNADNVYTSSNMTIAGEFETIGNYSKGTFIPKGTSLNSILSGMLQKELYPTNNDTPTILLSAKGGQGEVGSSYELPIATLKIEDVGSYEYGPPTGIIFDQEKVRLYQEDIEDNEILNSVSMTTGDTLTLQAQDEETLYKDSEKSYQFTVEATYSDGAIPFTNLDNEYSEAQIKSGFIEDTITVQFVGYRYAFAGGTDQEVINSEVVRSMSAKKNSKSSMDTKNEALEFTAAAGTTKVFFAYPTTWTGTPCFEMFGLAWAENTNFIKQEVSVLVADARGNDGYMDYNLYMWDLSNTPLEAETTNFRVYFK